MSRRPTIEHVERAVLVAVLVATLLAIAFALFGGLLIGRPGDLAEALYPVAVGLPFGGFVVVLILVAVYVERMMTPSDVRQPLADRDRSAGTYVAPQPVTDGIARKLQRATRLQYRWYWNDTGRDDADDLEERLHAGAVRVVQTTEGLDPAQARDAVEAGTWTDDPIAAGFLSDEVQYPLHERIRWMLDPGRTYRRRVRRTITAIENGNRTGSQSNTTASTQGSEVSQ